MRRIIVLCTLLLGAAAFASAATLTGTVKNLTTGKPSAGDQVTLMNLSQGMSELSHTKTDASGKFTFNIDNPDAPHLVRVTHDGVNYFPQTGPIRPGVTTVEVGVYDAATKIDGLSTTVNVMRVQADAGNLQILELVAVRNDSNPPRTLNGERTYEVYLPPSAHLDQAVAQAPGGMPLTIAPVADGNTGKHYLNFALKPGETRFEIAYHMPYSGEATFTPKITSNIQHFVVMMPKSMRFEAKEASRFSPMDNDPNAAIQVATAVSPSTDVSFRISGTGTLPDEQEAAQQDSASSDGAMGADNRPGGGLGPPTDAPDPLHKYRWFILGGLAVVLVAGGVFVVTRANQQNPTAAPVAQTPANPAVTASAERPAVKDRSAVLLEALKEELFQLEVERQQGRISAEEYDKSKAALDETIRRAISRQSS